MYKRQDEERALRPIKFIETFCKHSKGEWAGKPVILELFQKAYISALFGFIDKETNLRRYKESMFYVARKNGKSTMLSGIAAYMMIAAVSYTHLDVYKRQIQKIRKKFKKEV